jgi:hypothetical protein
VLFERDDDIEPDQVAAELDLVRRSVAEAEERR